MQTAGETDRVIFTGHKSLLEYKAPGLFHKEREAGTEAIEMAAQGGTVNSLLMKTVIMSMRSALRICRGSGHFLPVWNSCWKPRGQDKGKRRKDDEAFV